MTFLVNALSFLAVIFVLVTWKRQRTPPSDLHIVAAMGTGLRYVRHAPGIASVLVRTGVFILGGSAVWALLPLIARVQLGSGPAGYGILLGCMGGGAVAMSLAMPYFQSRTS